MRIDQAQSTQYMQGLATIDQNAATARQNGLTLKRQQDVREALEKQTTCCDGASTTAVCVWIKEINLAIRQLTPTNVVNVVEEGWGALRRKRNPECGRPATSVE